MFIINIDIILVLANTLTHFAYGGKATLQWEQDSLYSPSWSIFEGSAAWYNCPEGSVIGGFWKNNCNNLHCIEEMRCVAPSSPAISQSCYVLDMVSSFDNGGTVQCEDGYFVRGIYSNDNHEGNCGIYCWEYLNCCKFDGLTYDSTSASQDWWSCLDEDNVWCEVDNGDYITGFYRSSGGGGELYLLEAAKTRHLYDECAVTNINVPSQLITKSMDSFSNLIYTNQGYQEQMTTTMGSEASIEKESTFTHTSGLEIGASVSFGVSGGFVGTSVSSEMSLSVTATESFESSHTNRETITQTSPAVEYLCPARTTCTRQRILYKAPEQEVTMTLTLLCNTLGVRTVTGTYIARGGTEIEVVDSTAPMDCDYYTNDYYDRNNGKLPHCWNCNSNDRCTSCTDGKVELDNGECYNDDVCEACGGEVKADNSNSYGDSIGKYCSGEDMSLEVCTAFIENDLSR